MSNRNERETYPNQGRRPEQDEYSNAFCLVLVMLVLIIIAGYHLIEAYYPHLFNLIE